MKSEKVWVIETWVTGRGWMPCDSYEGAPIVRTLEVALAHLADIHRDPLNPYSYRLYNRKTDETIPMEILA